MDRSDHLTAFWIGIMHSMTAKKSLVQKLRNRAGRLKAETYGLYLAARDRRTPWYVRFLVAAIAAYALSPIDLIPDFIPIIGYLDDLVLLPMLITLAIRLIPDQVLTECQGRAQRALESSRPVSRIAAGVILAFWSLSAALISWWAYNAFAPKQF